MDKTEDLAGILNLQDRITEGTRGHLHQVVVVNLLSVDAVVVLSTALLLRQESRPKHLPTPTGPKRVLILTLRFGARKFTISASSMLRT